MSSSGTKLLGIRVDRDPGLEEAICSVANGCLKLQALAETVSEGDVKLNANYVGEGYGIPTLKSREAMKQLWQVEGILLDFVYTGKAFAGLVDLAQSGALSNERVVFLHTGGMAAFFGSTA
jgi:L-cysteate sulfo-lyase